jgi:hypothetical protein
MRQYHNIIDRLSSQFFQSQQAAVHIEIKSPANNQEDEHRVDEIIADIQAGKRDSDVLIGSISNDASKWLGASSCTNTC